ncbi:hypothetical protein LOZ66_005227 [Ophidiomyces ophidiicola]|nr:hypothetical protein LOZ66_005227 [Ophidiomyces ophidiicola]
MRNWAPEPPITDICLEDFGITISEVNDKDEFLRLIREIPALGSGSEDGFIQAHSRWMDDEATSRER